MGDYATYSNIPYEGATHPRQSLDLYIPSSASPSSRLLVWVHGGAWRSEAKEDFVNTLVPRMLKLTNLPLAVVEYRLTPEISHPEHILDVISGLSLLMNSALLPCENGAAKWDRTNLALAGHSVGAFLCCQLTLEPPTSLTSFSVPPRVRQAIKSIMIIAGIYDLNDMLDEYPDYASWTEEAIGLDKQVLEMESVANWKLFEDEAGKGLEVFVVSGKEDELVSERQADLMLKRLKGMLGNRQEDIDKRLKVDYDTVKGTHDSMLHRDEIPQLWAEFAKQ
ncbi:alpha/beta hydrolase [Sporobolomyces salmoneus]|uniref:alpha/beta hydrolase n=1 Tax=Sporobolomyces salmoneus TaxID=183962 RepID=UPI00316D6707